MHVFRNRRVALALAVCLAALASLSCAAEYSGTDGSVIVSRDEISPTGRWQWSPEDDCLFCHGNLLDNAVIPCVGEPLENQHCWICHENRVALEESHARIGMNAAATAGAPMVSAAACLRCHGGQDLASRTAGIPLVDDLGMEINPHDIPLFDSHSEIACASCHRMHEGDIREQSLSRCFSCHHERDFRCGYCHPV